MKTQVEKKLPATQLRNEEADKLMKLASEDQQSEKDMSDFMDMKYEMALEKYLKNNPGKTEQDFIEEFIQRIPLKDGSKIIQFSKYKKTNTPKVKELRLSDLFTPETTLAELDENQKATLNALLRLTFGRKE